MPERAPRTSDAARLEKVRALFDAAMEKPPAERRALVEQAAGADTALREEVLALLADEEAARDFLGGAAALPTSLADAAAPEADALIGRRIGPYRVLGEIAHGGMGTVYRAVRADDAFAKVVALKVVHGGAASETLKARFHRERQILGRLQHPNIAAIFDGGTTEDGQPYLVMEHVEGLPIDRYCAERRASPREIVELFRQVCAAVHYAHQNLVVHRDVKPANILVNAEGMPKLLDFGIAKLLAAGLDPDEAPTATLLPVMTPEYASPEQVTGEPVTTVSDVYSLGVVLYELLAGRRPYAVKTRSMEDVVRTVCHTEPAAPSTVAVGGRRAELAGDLDTIVMKALRKEPHRRYASAQDLSEDLGRFLEARPVRARPDTMRYRAAKFVRRNRLAVAAAAAVVLALVAGLFAASRQARIAERERARAERRFQDVRRLAQSLIFELHDRIHPVAGTTEARKLLVQRAAEYLDLLARDAPADASLAEELAGAHERLAEIVGGTDFASLGDEQGARAHMARAVAIRERLLAERPGDRARALALSAVLARLTYHEDDPRRGLAHATRAVALATPLVAADPAHVDAVKALGTAHYAAGAAHSEAADWTASLAAFESAAAAFERQVSLTGNSAQALRNRALCDKRIGALLLRSSRYAEAAARYEKALAADEARVALAPGDAQARRDVSVTRVDLALVHQNRGDHPRAITHLQEAVRIREELARLDPRNLRATQDLASARYRLGDLLSRRGDARDALEHLDAAARLAAQLPRQWQDMTADVLANRARAHDRAGRRADARTDRREALALVAALLEEAPSAARELRYAELALELADDLRAGGSCAEARPVYEAGLQRALAQERAGKLIGDDVRLPEQLRAGLASCASRP